MVYTLTHSQVCKKKQNRDAGIQYALFLDFLLRWDSATLRGCRSAGPASYNCDLRSRDLLHLLLFFCCQPERGIIQTSVGHSWNSPAKLFFTLSVFLPFALGSPALSGREALWRAHIIVQGLTIEASFTGVLHFSAALCSFCLFISLFFVCLCPESLVAYIFSPFPLQFAVTLRQASCNLILISLKRIKKDFFCQSRFPSLPTSLSYLRVS